MEENGNRSDERLILHLPGINKSWVRHKGEWVDIATLNKPKKVVQEPIQEIEEPEGPSKKWWKFWG